MLTLLNSINPVLLEFKKQSRLKGFIWLTNLKTSTITLEKLETKRMENNAEYSFREKNILLSSMGFSGYQSQEKRDLLVLTQSYQGILPMLFYLTGILQVV